MKTTAVSFRAAKGQRKLSMLTAYDYTTARLMDACQIDALLVGDSLGMVMLGYADTLSVTMEDMIHHCAAVARGASRPLIVCDMPFMSYHLSPEQACANAGRLLKEGRAQAVKLEGGADFAEHIRLMVRASIPVMGHLGLTPQSINALGGFKVQGKAPEAAQKLLDDARALEAAGVFAIVLECVPAPARTVTGRCWSGRTCWAWSTAFPPSLCATLPKAARPCSRPSMPMPRPCRTALFPRRSIATAWTKKCWKSCASRPSRATTDRAAPHAGRPVFFAGSSVPPWAAAGHFPLAGPAAQAGAHEKTGEGFPSPVSVFSRVWCQN